MGADTVIGDLRHRIRLMLEHEAGMANEAALQSTERLLRDFCARWGGERAYIPKFGAAAANHAETIRAESRNGTSQRAIARKLGISHSTVSRKARVMRSGGGFGRDDWNL